MQYDFNGYSLTGTLVLSGTLEATDLRAARSTASFLLVNGPFAGMGPVGSITASPSIMPPGWRDSTRWHTIRDYDGVEIGRLALSRADGKTFRPNR